MPRKTQTHFGNRRFGRGFFAGALLLLGVSVAPAQSFEYVNFAGATDISLVGSSTLINNSLRLTAALNSQSGTAWHTNQVNVVSPWTTTFEFAINPVSGGADGMTFAIQSNSPTAIGNPGSGGGGLAYDGMPNSLVVEFDHYNNGVNNDPNGNHISIHTEFSAPNSPNENSSIGSTTAISNLGGIHSVTINYDGTTMSITYDGTVVLTAPVDMSQVVGGTSAFVGFTAATGGLNEEHRIQFWGFTGGSEIQRGDVNGDGSLQIGDSLMVLNHLFLPPYEAVPCEDAADADDDGVLTVADGIRILGDLFSTTLPTIAPPRDSCASDPSPDTLTCELIVCP